MATKSLPSPKADVPHYQGHRQRLKDKFNTVGADFFADYELLELVLFQAVPRTDTKPLAKYLIEKFGSIQGVFAASPTLLKEIKGVGDHVVHILKLHHATQGRCLREEIKRVNILQSWQQVIDYCTATMAFDDVEQLRILYLDQRNQVLDDVVQQTGTVNHTPIYPREVMKRALEVGATALILVHNHPSGDPTPSRADIDLTIKMQRIADDLGIVLHDHVIIGKGCHSSLKSLGVI